MAVDIVIVIRIPFDTLAITLWMVKTISLFKLGG